MKLIVGTQVRVAPPSRDRLIRLAEAGCRVAGRPGPLHSPNIAAICAALLTAFAHNEALRREISVLEQRLVVAEGWGDEPTRGADTTYPVLVAGTRHGKDPK